jgi:hypothetical protein
VQRVVHERRIPKGGERVLAQSKEGLFAVLNLHHDGSQTADLKLIGHTGVVLKRLHWEGLSSVSPCQL